MSTIPSSKSRLTLKEEEDDEEAAYVSPREQEISSAVKAVQKAVKRVVTEASEGSKNVPRVCQEAEKAALVMVLAVEDLEKKILGGRKDGGKLSFSARGKSFRRRTHTNIVASPEVEQNFPEIIKETELLYKSIFSLVEFTKQMDLDLEQDFLQKHNARVTEKIKAVLKLIEDKDDDEEEEEKKKGGKGEEEGDSGEELKFRDGFEYMFELAKRVGEMIMKLQEEHAGLSAEKVLESAKAREGNISLLISLARKFARSREDLTEQQQILDAASETSKSSTALLAAQKVYLTRADSKPDLEKYIKVADQFSNDLVQLLTLMIQVKLAETTSDKNMNLWDEKKEEGMNVQIEKSVIIAGTLNQLVLKLTDPEERDPVYETAFISTFQSFTTPMELFKKLMQRYDVPRRRYRDMDSAEWKKKVVDPHQKRVLEIFLLWINQQFTDFNYSLIKRLSEALEKQVRFDGHVQLGDKIDHAVRQKVEFLQRSGPPLVRLIKPGLDLNKFLFKLKPEQFARQLVLSEFEVFQKLQKTEFLNQSWLNPKLKHRSPNILRILERSELFSSWIATAVVSVADKKKRIKVYKQIVSLGQECLALKSYNTVYSIITGLNSPAISRLKFATEDVPKETIDALNQLKGAVRYEKANANGLMKGQRGPTVPPLSVYLSELLKIDQDMPDRVGNLINFKKRQAIGYLLEEISMFQITKYPFKVDEEIMSVIENITAVSSQQLYNLSLARQGR